MFEILEQFTICMLFSLSVIFFSNFKLSKNSFRNTIRVSISLDTDQI